MGRRKIRILEERTTFREFLRVVFCGKTSFEGIFEGNNHTIDGIYIDLTESTKGLFRENKGTIQNLTIASNSYIKGKGNVGGIAGALGKNGKVEECYNKGIVDMKAGIITGGIVASLDSGSIENCYNTGTIISNSSCDTFGGILGYGGYTDESVGDVKNCYNVGKLQTGTHLLGGVIGNDEKSKVNATNNYWLDTCGASVGIGRPSGNTNAVKKTAAEIKNLASTLGEAYTNDVQNEDGTWKYNDGYPILKWQLEN